jgi:hypothetical protein
VRYRKGLRRIANAIRWLGDFMTTALIVVSIVDLVKLEKIKFKDLTLDDLWLFLGLCLVIALIFSGGGRLLAWIIRGLAEPPKKPR